MTLLVIVVMLIHYSTSQLVAHLNQLATPTHSPPKPQSSFLAIDAGASPLTHRLQ